MGFSRLPVYEGRIDNVVGILHHLDLLGAENSETPIGDLIRPVHFAPENQEVDELLFIPQRQAASAAIVVDEFGGAVGLITLEDIMEEIVGEIHDEFDRQAAPGARSPMVISSWRGRPSKSSTTNSKSTYPSRLITKQWRATSSTNCATFPALVNRFSYPTAVD